VAGRIWTIRHSVRYGEARGGNDYGGSGIGAHGADVESGAVRRLVCRDVDGRAWLEPWFGIENGAFLFRVAALDLPFFGAYTVYRAIHQGRRRFLQLVCAQVLYALTKLAGVLLLINFELSVENAVLVNVAAAIVGLIFLIPGGGLGWQGRWLKHITPLLLSATPMGLYYFLVLLRDWLVFGRSRSCLQFRQVGW
jgi:hypothetical protein